MQNNIIAGLISGVTVTLFVIVFRAFWTRIAVPWFEERVYKDVRIEGQWFSLYPTTEERRQEAITLERQGHAVTGVMICTSGYDEGEKYQVSGSFRNLILPLIYESADRTRTDRGSITLKLVRNAQRFEGKVAAYHSRADVIGDIDVMWFRSKKALGDHLARIEQMKQQAVEFRKRQREADEAKKKLTKMPDKSDSPKDESHEAPDAPETPQDPAGT